MKGYIYRSAIFVLFLGLLMAAPAFARRGGGQSQEPKSEQGAAAPTQDDAVPSDRITVRQLKKMMDANEEVVIVDNRAASAWVGSTVKIKGAIHITVDELERKMKDLPKNKLIVTYCT
jgi:hypothetical protein